MTVRINKPALNLREELTKAQGVVRYEQRQFWMDGLVENGTFDNDLSGWAANLYATLSLQSNQLRVENNQAQVGEAYQLIAAQAGKKYMVTFDLTALNGVEAQFYINTAPTYLGYPIAGSKYNTLGTYSFTFTAPVTNAYVVLGHRGNNTAGLYAQYDNIAVFEVDENDNVIHSVPLGFKPVHVYEDGLLQREGENNDYTVVDTGFEYQIKPTVAPTGATETCVIAEREL